MKSSYAKVATASERIKQALNLRNMKQVELSEKSGINKPSISCYVSGKYEPKQSALYDLGKALDVSEMWLAGYDVPMERRIEKNNDTIADIVVRMRTDSEFFSVIKTLNGLDDEKLASVKQMLAAFLK